MPPIIALGTNPMNKGVRKWWRTNSFRHSDLFSKEWRTHITIANEPMVLMNHASIGVYLITWLIPYIKVQPCDSQRCLSDRWKCQIISYNIRVAVVNWQWASRQWYRLCVEIGARKGVIAVNLSSQHRMHRLAINLEVEMNRFLVNWQAEFGFSHW